MHSNILFYEHVTAGNYPTALEPLCESIARRRPGKVIAAFPRVDDAPKCLIDAGVNVAEFDFYRDGQEFIWDHYIRHVYMFNMPLVSSAYRRARRAGVKSIVLHQSRNLEATTGMERTLAKFGPWRANTYVAESRDILAQLKAEGVPASRCQLTAGFLNVAVEVFDAAMLAR